MHANRMSALKKLKMKLGRSGSLKKRKDETHRVSNGENLCGGTPPIFNLILK